MMSSSDDDFQESPGGSECVITGVRGRLLWIIHTSACHPLPCLPVYINQRRNILTSKTNKPSSLNTSENHPEQAPSRQLQHNTNICICHRLNTKHLAHLTLSIAPPRAKSNGGSLNVKRERSFYISFNYWHGWTMNRVSLSPDKSGMMIATVIGSERFPVSVSTQSQGGQSDVTVGGSEIRPGKRSQVQDQRQHRAGHGRSTGFHCSWLQLCSGGRGPGRPVPTSSSAFSRRADLGLQSQVDTVTRWEGQWSIFWGKESVMIEIDIDIKAQEDDRTKDGMRFVI